MKTFTIKTRITDGKIQLGELACDLPSGAAEVVVVINPVEETGPPYDMLEGALAGVFPADMDLDAELDEIRQQWKVNLEPQ